MIYQFVLGMKAEGGNAGSATVPVRELGARVVGTVSPPCLPGLCFPHWQFPVKGGVSCYPLGSRESGVWGHLIPVHSRSYRNRTQRIEPLPTARGKDYGRHWGRGGGWSGAGAKRLVPHPCVTRFHCGLLQNRSCILFMLAWPQRLIRRICRNMRMKRGSVRASPALWSLWGPEEGPALLSLLGHCLLKANLKVLTRTLYFR